MKQEEKKKRRERERGRKKKQKAKLQRKREKKEKRKISSEPIDAANVVQYTEQLKISRTTAFKVGTSGEEQVKTIRLCYQLLIKLVNLCPLYL